MYDFLGVTENFSGIAGIPFTMRWSFGDKDGKAVSLDGTTFRGSVQRNDGEETAFTFRKSDAEGEAHIVIVGCEGLPEGRHFYEIYAVSDTGKADRLVSGHLGILPSVEAARAAIAPAYESRTLLVRLPGDATRHVQLEWLASTVAQIAAEQAWAYLDEVRRKHAEVEQMKQEAEDKFGDLNAMSDAIEEAKQFIAETIENTVPYIGDNDNWWRGTGDNAYDLGKRAVGRDGADGINGVDGKDGADGKDGIDGKDGEDGKSPVIRYVDADVDGEHYEGLYWFNWDAETQAYDFSKVRAEAKDGMPGVDADTFRTLYVESADELPEEGDKNTIYYVPQRNAQGEVELYHMWKWLEHMDGTYAWHNMFDTPTIDYFAQKGLENVPVLAADYEMNYPDSYLPKISWVKKAVNVIVGAAVQQINKLATETAMGLLKLGSSNQYEDGAWLATNNAGQGVIPSASTTRYGASKLSTSAELNESNAGYIGVNAAGQLMAYMAGYGRVGGLILGTQYQIVCNDADHCVPIPTANGETTFNQYAGNMNGAIIFNLAQEGCLVYNAAGPNGANYGNSLWLRYDSNSLTIENGVLKATPWVTDTVADDNPKPVSSKGLKKYVEGEDFADKEYVQAQIKEALKAYVTSEDLKKTLSSYALATTLSNYVTSSELTSKLASYVTSASLTSSLGNYVKVAEGSAADTLWAGTLSAYTALSAKNAKTAYLCRES